MMHVECVSSIDSFINEPMITSYILMTHEECVIDSFIKKFIITSHVTVVTVYCVEERNFFVTFSHTHLAFV